MKGGHLSRHNMEKDFGPALLKAGRISIMKLLEIEKVIGFIKTISKIKQFIEFTVQICDFYPSPEN